MGLSIHYEFRSDARRACKARRLVETLRQGAMDIRRFWVRQVVDWTGTACEREAHRTARRRRLATEATRWIDHEGARHPVRPERMIGFSLFIGEGAEQATFALAIYPESIRNPGTGLLLPTGLHGWCWKSSCQTQHSGEDGIDNFVRCHTTLVKVLDCAQELGILASVSDDGNYWRTRDLEVLRASFTDWNAMVAGQIKCGRSVPMRGVSQCR